MINMKMNGTIVSKLKVLIIILLQISTFTAKATAEVNYAGSYEMSNWLEGIFGSAGVWIIAIIAAIIVWFVLDKKNSK